MHPLEQTNLKISTPVDNDKVIMLKMMDQEEAEEILLAFQQTGIDWVSNPRERNMEYKKVIKNGNRNEIAGLVNTLMRHTIELKKENKKLYEQDRRILDMTQNILFKELAMTLDTTFEKIHSKVNSMIKFG